MMKRWLSEELGLARQPDAELARRDERIRVLETALRGWIFAHQARPFDVDRNEDAYEAATAALAPAEAVAVSGVDHDG